MAALSIFRFGWAGYLVTIEVITLEFGQIWAQG
jgi:hypothetical protein